MSVCQSVHRGSRRDSSDGTPPVPACLPDLFKALLSLFLFCTSDALYEEFGERPHVIINNLHRSKLDANRDKPEATFGNQIAGMISAH